MLVLSRKRDESIVIGDDIVLTVVEIRGDKVRLGIEAPKEIPVHRLSVHLKILRHNFRSGFITEEEFLTYGGSPADALRIKQEVRAAGGDVKKS